MLAVNYSTLRNNLKDYCDEASDNNQTIIVITHDASIAQEANRVITIEDGKIVSDVRN